MGHHHHDHRNTERVCIKTRKVFDWVTRQVNLPQITFSNNALKGIFTCNGSKANPCDVLSENQEFSVNCNLTPNSLTCQEIMQPGGRQPVTVTLPSGETVTLERVKLLIRGTVTIEIVNAAGMVVCTSSPIPFATTQNFLLCAPEGTDVDCTISFFECDATLICTNDLSLLEINITLCVDVQVEADVKLEIEARFCTPREEILEAATVCPTPQFPPQCPEVFPG